MILLDGLLLGLLPGGLKRGESSPESGEGLLDASRVVQGDAGRAQAGDAEGHRDAMVAGFPLMARIVAALISCGEFSR
jgi:hypothetical protein